MYNLHATDYSTLSCFIFKSLYTVIFYKNLHTRIIFHSDLSKPWSSKNLILKVDITKFSRFQVFIGDIFFVVELLPVDSTKKRATGILQQATTDIL